MSPLKHWPRQILLGLVQGYRWFLSPWLGSSCGYEPTCSRYAMQALEQHGASVGAYLMVARIVRCRPGCAGGHDPVPEQAPKIFRLFTRFSAASAGAPNDSGTPR